LAEVDERNRGVETERAREADPPELIVIEGADMSDLVPVLRRRRGSSAPGEDRRQEQDEASEAVEEPAKVMRIAQMVTELLEEVRHASLDEAGRARLRQIYEQSVRELATTLSPDLVQELDRMARPFDTPSPSDAELRVAQAQLVGWLEGLFHGIQAAIFAQQVEAQMQLEQMRRQSLPPGFGPKAPSGAQPSTGAYL
jgi:hypothetical protein